ncbi:hypothetical protein NQ176_g2835 [Zarea fungicola]|uniref:Uncharacterized protein n=1 Tax=Zarea fungicola TaxID=93591 RepID=A0ACC1NM12_9HYPO|nr:hypothetical protein NQ176_g2835 [Lecanicillium fungicola]
MDHHHSTLKLRNVLHVPSTVCNIIGQPIEDEYGVVLSGDRKSGRITLRDGSPVAFFSPEARFLEVRLSGPPIGPRVAESPFQPGMQYNMTVIWPSSEREKWVQRPVERKPLSVAAEPTGEYNDVSLSDEGKFHAVLQPEQKRWLKEHYGGELQFLHIHCLRAHIEEDRSEGYRILCKLMELAVFSSTENFLDLLPEELKYLERKDVSQEVVMGRFGLIRDYEEHREQAREIIRRMVQQDMEIAPTSRASAYDGYFALEELAFVHKYFRDVPTYFNVMGLDPEDDFDLKSAQQRVERCVAGVDETPLVQTATEGDSTAVGQPMVKPLTISELRWIKHCYGGLRIFMAALELDPDDEADMERVAGIVRLEMATVGESKVEDGDDIDWEHASPSMRVARSYFNDDEYRWIQKRYGDAVTFMSLLHLRVDWPDKGKQAQEIVQILMQD